MWRGAWDEAEREFSSATDELAACRPRMTGEGLVRLGELRRRQGKLDEAMTFFERAGTHSMASLGRASWPSIGTISNRLQNSPIASAKTAAAKRDRARRRPRVQIRAQTELGNRVMPRGT